MKKFAVLMIFAFLAISMISLALAEENETNGGNETAETNNITAENETIVNETIEEDNSARLVISAPINRTKIVVTGTKHIPQPAALFCERLGYSAETETNSKGKKYEVCVFPDG